MNQRRSEKICLRYKEMWPLRNREEIQWVFISSSVMENSEDSFLTF